MTFEYVDWFNKDLNESKILVQKNESARIDKKVHLLGKQNETISNTTRISPPKVVAKMNMTVLNRILNDSAKVAAPSNQTKKGIVIKKIKKV